MSSGSSLPLLLLSCFSFFSILLAILTLHSIIVDLDTASSHQDYQPLISFKSTCDDPHNALSSWNSSTNPCTWDFITCFDNRVSKLNLQNLSLDCSIHPLTSLTHLRVLNLKHNRFNGRIPFLSNLQSLNVVILSHNHFSGYFPMIYIKVRELHHLYYLDLSHNNFYGDIPYEINDDLPRVPYRFSSDIRFLHRDFDISIDPFSGDSPGDVGPNEGLSRDPDIVSPSERVSMKDMISKEVLLFAIVFLSLCLKEKCIPKPKGIRKKLIKKKSPGPGPSPGSSQSSSEKEDDQEELVCKKKSPGPGPGPARGPSPGSGPSSSEKENDQEELVCKKKSPGPGPGPGPSPGAGPSSSEKEDDQEELVCKKKSPGPGPVPVPGPSPGSGPSSSEKEDDREEFVCFEGMKKLDRQDLMSSPSDLIMEGMKETTNVILEDDDLASVIWRINRKISGRKEMEQYMDVLGKLRHPNVVSLRAYLAYMDCNQMVLVYDIFAGCRLFNLLHGEDGSNKGELNWIARHRIAAGVGRGLAYIHNSCKAQKLTHGNIQSFNISMCNDDEEPQLAESGLSALTPSILSNDGYRAPEESDGQESTQKSEVYSFGVLLLELVTGKCPSKVQEGWPNGDVAIDLPRWVQSVTREEWPTKVVDIDLMKNRRYEDEIMELLEIAMSCCVADPDERPTMSEVVGMIEDIGIFLVKGEDY